MWTCKAQKQAIVQWDCNVFQSNATKHIRHIVLTIVTWQDPTTASSSPLNHFNLHNVLASITVPYWWDVFNCRPRGSVEQYFKFRMRNPIVLFALFVFFCIWSFHLRSFERYTPRYLVVSIASRKQPWSCEVCNWKWRAQVVSNSLGHCIWQYWIPFSSFPPFFQIKVWFTTVSYTHLTLPTKRIV